MRISVKGRYAIAAAISMAEHYPGHDYSTVVSLASSLGISKIYLEQVFSLLRRGGIVNSVKGAQGGYHLARRPQQITVLDILTAIEVSLFEPAEETVAAKAPEIDQAMRSFVFSGLDQAIRSTLGSLTLQDLVSEAARQRSEQNMYFI